jgi:rare lipoprotein A
MPISALAQWAEFGKASYYADRFLGMKTASGELYHPDSLTAAHRTLPFGSRVRVTNTRNNITVIVTINDRGPFLPGRVLDLSKRAMAVLKGLGRGVIEVKIEAVVDDR